LGLSSRHASLIFFIFRFSEPLADRLSEALCCQPFFNEPLFTSVTNYSLKVPVNFFLFLVYYIWFVWYACHESEYMVIKAVVIINISKIVSLSIFLNAHPLSQCTTPVSQDQLISFVHHGIVISKKFRHWQKILCAVYILNWLVSFNLCVFHSMTHTIAVIIKDVY